MGGIRRQAVFECASFVRSHTHALGALLPPPCPAGMLLPVPKFSKFLHGAALLFQRSCCNVPYWFLLGQQAPPADRHGGPLPFWRRQLSARVGSCVCLLMATLVCQGLPYLPARLLSLQMSGTPPS